MNRFNIILTECCNAKCTHCYMGNNKSKRTMSKEDIDIIINKLINTESIVLTGGEIFLQKDLLFYAIKKIKNHDSNIIVKLESNGSYFYKDLSLAKDKLIELKSIGVDSIRFSLDPFHEEGGIDLEKVKDLKELESEDTPKIEYLVQDKVLAIGRAESLDEKYIEKRNCMNNKNTINNPYFFIDVLGNVYICTWKCIPPIGNIIKEDFNNILESLNSDFNKNILEGKVLKAISLLNNDYDGNKDYIEKYGECKLCDNYFKKEKIRTL